MISNAEEKT